MSIWAKWSKLLPIEMSERAEIPKMNKTLTPHYHMHTHTVKQRKSFNRVQMFVYLVDLIDQIVHLLSSVRIGVQMSLSANSIGNRSLSSDRTYHEWKFQFTLSPSERKPISKCKHRRGLGSIECGERWLNTQPNWTKPLYLINSTQRLCYFILCTQTVLRAEHDNNNNIHYYYHYHYYSNDCYKNNNKMRIKREKKKSVTKEITQQTIRTQAKLHPIQRRTGRAER